MLSTPSTHHSKHVSKAREYKSMPRTQARKHVKHASTPNTQARKHPSTRTRQARKHSKHVSMQTRQARKQVNTQSTLSTRFSRFDKLMVVWLIEFSCVLGYKGKKRSASEIMFYIFYYFPSSEVATGGWGLRLYFKKDSGGGVFLWILWNFQEHLFYRAPVDDCFCFF